MKKLNLIFILVFVASMGGSVSATEFIDTSNFIQIHSNSFSNEFLTTNVPIFIPMSPTFFGPSLPNQDINIDENDMGRNTNFDLPESENSFSESFPVSIKPVEEAIQINFSEPRYSISSKERALGFVQSEIKEYAQHGAPGAVGSPYEPEWSIVTVDPEPVLIYTTQGTPLYYDFLILQSGNEVATIRVSAPMTSDEGIRIIRIVRPALSVNFDESYKIALDLAREKYPEAHIESGILVAYTHPGHPGVGFPTLGFLITLKDLETGVTRKLIVNAYYHEIAQDVPAGLINPIKSVV